MLTDEEVMAIKRRTLGAGSDQGLLIDALMESRAQLAAVTAERDHLASRSTSDEQVLERYGVRAVMAERDRLRDTVRQAALDLGNAAALLDMAMLSDEAALFRRCGDDARAALTPAPGKENDHD